MNLRLLDLLKTFGVQIFLGLAMIVGATSAHSEEASVKASFRLFPVGDFKAATQEVNGTAQIVGKKVIAENIRVNLNSLVTGNDTRDKHMKEKLLTSKFPEAILVRAEGENGTGQGLLKVKNIDQEIKGTYEITPDNKFLKATFDVSLSKFNIERINFKGVGVNDLATLAVVVPIRTDAKGQSKNEELSLDTKNPSTGGNSSAAQKKEVPPSKPKKK